MKKNFPNLKNILAAAGAFALAGLVSVPAFAAPDPIPNGKPQTFSFKDGGQELGEFLLNGKPFQIRAAEIHPQRIPREYWRHRIKMAKAVGLNTIAFYTFWNVCEQPDGKFDFTGRNDFAEWMKICADEGMWVLFRPGPYVCGEWDFGGLPVYLYKEPGMKVRHTSDKNYMKAQERWLKAIAAVAKPFLAKNGGPILMTQIENEFGSYRKEPAYMQYLHKFWIKQGFGPFYTSDGASDHHLGGVTLPGVAVGLDPGENDNAFETARRNNPGVPVFSSETYPGWLRHWGEGNWAPTNKSGAIKWFMEKKRSFSLFVFHGGTNFGFTAGANSGGKGGYEPDLTSYDYGSPCDEQGNPTKEYEQYREIIAGYIPSVKKIPVPKPIPAMEIKNISLKFFAPLRSNCGKQMKAQTPPFFESFGQNQGMAFYKTQIPAGGEAELTFDNLSDYGQIFVDKKLIDTVDRRLGKKSVTIPARAKPAELEIAVEAMGHVNFSLAMERDRKGLFGSVKLAGTELRNWTIVPKPLAEDEICVNAKPGKQTDQPGGHFRGEFSLTKTEDTFLDMSKWSKGTVYVNGINLGRYWKIGPQLRLYCPAPFLKRGRNIIDVVELEQRDPMPIRGCETRNRDMNGIKTANKNNVW